MKHQEADLQRERLAKYNQLNTLRNEVNAALDVITEKWQHGPCGQGPFTGNTRESRRIRTMHIEFTQTRGGAPPVNIDIPVMHIEAWDVGRALETLLRAKLEEINKAMEEI